MPATTRVRYEVDDGIAVVALDHPPVNALSAPMLDELLAALERARIDDAVRAVVLASADPRIFCAGIDLKALVDAPHAVIYGLLERLYTQLTDAQYRLGKPSIAAVAGSARGGGMTLAISCDVIVAESDASFGYPEIDVGVIPAIHFAHLPRIVGRHRAFELLFSGRAFDAREAASLGLVSRVVEPGQALASARGLARVFAGKPPGVLRMGRHAFHRECDSDFRRGVANAVENFCNVFATDEAREGLRAFAEKRAPAWKKRSPRR